MTELDGNPTHCRVFGWMAGDCGKLHCSRCGQSAYRTIAHRIIKATMKKTKVFFVTVYYDRKRQSLAELPLFDFSDSDEKNFRQIISKVLEALRKKIKRLGGRLEYVAVIAFGKMDHKIHKRVHCHILLTDLPDIKPRPSNAHPNRLECVWMVEKLAGFHLLAWVELPASKLAVARYTAKNLQTVIGKDKLKGVKAFRFSRGYEK